MSAGPTLRVVSGEPNSETAGRETLSIVIVGREGSGKSTVTAHLLHDSGSHTADGRQGLQTAGSARDVPSRPPQAQAVSEAAGAQDSFGTARRDYVIIDPAGHRDLLRNILGGACEAAAAVLVIDAQESLRQQTACHGRLLHLLGIKQVVVAVNKMDLAGHAEARFAAAADDVSAYLGEIGVEPAAVVPMTAHDGGNIAGRSARMPWYAGPTVVEALDGFAAPCAVHDQALRFSVQEVRKLDGRRVIGGRIESGVLRVGDRLLFSPSDKTARVEGIEPLDQGPVPREAKAGQSIGITLDEQVFVERGNVASLEHEPPILTPVFRATVFWNGRSPLVSGRALELKLAASEAPVRVQSIDGIFDSGDLRPISADCVETGQVAEITLRSRVILALDEYTVHPQTGRCVLIDGEEGLVARGLIDMEGYPDRRGQFTVRSTNITAVEHRVTQDARSGRNGHSGGVLWLTGLSGAGKSTLAMALEQLLFAKGYHVYVLDGDNVRHGLNADLGFSPEERAENIRRVGEVAALFADAGFIVITAFISPYQSDRDRARKAGPDTFHEIYVKADLETCERRDPKGLYRKARSGEISEFTGVSAPYQEPSHAELVVDTSTASVDECLDCLVEYAESRFALERRAGRAL